MSPMMQILEDLTPLNRIMCSTDLIVPLSTSCAVLPMEVFEYPAAPKSTMAG